MPMVGVAVIISGMIWLCVYVVCVVCTVMRTNHSIIVCGLNLLKGYRNIYSISYICIYVRKI